MNHHKQVVTLPSLHCHGLVGSRPLLGSCCLVCLVTDLSPSVFHSPPPPSNKCSILHIHARERVHIILLKHFTQKLVVFVQCSDTELLSGARNSGVQVQGGRRNILLVMQCIALFCFFVLFPHCFNDSKNSPSKHGWMCWSLSARFPGNVLVPVPAPVPGSIPQPDPVPDFFWSRWYGQIILYSPIEICYIIYLQSFTS